MTRDHSGSSSQDAAEREAADQHWGTVVATANLVRNLIALADRYDAEAQADAGRAAERHSCAMQMRTTAEAGRQLIRSLAPPLSLNDPPGPAPALGLDGQARAYTLVTRLEERAVLRQAQGVLMQRAGLTAGEAFEAMLLLATRETTLLAVAEHVVRTSELPVAYDEA